MKTPRKTAKTAKKTTTPVKQTPVKKTREELVAETIEEAMRPYLGVLPPHALATMRDILEDTMATHPVALEALDELDAEQAQKVDRSGTRVRDGGEGGEGSDDEGSAS